MGIFDIVHGEQGDSIVLNGMRIAGPSYELIPKVTLDKLRAENTELRNLVGGLMSCPVHRDDCVKWKCKHLKVVSKGENGDRPRYVCTLCERAKEMGIEEER